MKSPEPRPHAVLIKQWADGAEIEQYVTRTGTWELSPNPAWLNAVSYRVKVEPTLSKRAEECIKESLLTENTSSLREYILTLEQQVKKIK